MAGQGRTDFRKEGEQFSGVPTSRLGDILEIAEDGIVTVNSKQEIVLFNRGAAKLFGFSPDEVLGRQLEVLIPTQFHAVHRRHMEDFSRSPVTSRLMAERREVYGRRKDGSEFPAEISISKIAGNAEPLFTAIVRDVTERKRYEKEILQLNQELEDRVTARTAELAERNLQLAQKNEEHQRALADLQAKTEELRSTTQQLWQAAKLAGVGELAASIAHELNNPLGTVSLRIESLLAKTPVDDPRRKSLEIIEQEVERMGRLVGNLLQFSRAGREQVSTVDVCEEILKTIELAEHHLRRRNVRIATDFHPSVPVIYADRQHLRQVFLNLFTNAGDAMHAGGMLTIRVRPDEMKAGKPGVAIEVADTGVGIAAEHLPRVTEAFFTTKDEGKGTGLGLAICRRIVQEHQGVLQIESEPGKGTTVRITLPVRNGANLSYLPKEQIT